MGFTTLSISLLMAAAPVAPDPGSSAPAAPVMPAMEARAFEQLLRTGSVRQLEQGCRNAVASGLTGRLEDLRDRLMVVAPAPQPFTVVAANTRALLACKAPDSARQVLGRYGPGYGPHRQDWLILSWRSAAAALDHGRAALALRRLAEGRLQSLDGLRLPLGDSAGGEPITRNALDQLAEHEAALGRLAEAVDVLASGRASGLSAARRFHRSVQWLDQLGQPVSSDRLETALEQAAEAQAWSLAEDLLWIQLRLERQAGGDGSIARARLERLAARVDDTYTLRRLLDAPSPSPANPGRRLMLERQLCSPRAPGGNFVLKESEVRRSESAVSPATP